MDEADEISIKDAAALVTDAFGFKGDVVVSLQVAVTACNARVQF